MLFKRFGFLIANICLAFGSASVFAQANPISALFGAAQQIFPTQKTSGYTKVKVKNNKKALRTRHQNHRAVENHVLSNVNRAAGGLVRAVLYTPIETVQMISKQTSYKINHLKYKKEGKRAWHLRNKNTPHVGNPVIPVDTTIRSENFTGQDISILGKQNNLLNLILPIFGLDTKSHNESLNLIYTASNENIKKSLNSHLHDKKAHKVKHATNTKHIRTQQPHSLEKKHTSDSIHQKGVIKSQPIDTVNTLKPTVLPNHQSFNPNKSPASIDKLVPVNNATPMNTKPITDMFLTSPFAQDPYKLNKTNLTIPYKPQTTPSDSNNTNSLELKTPNNGFNAIPVNQDTPIKPYETCPKPDKNQV